MKKVAIILAAVVLAIIVCAAAFANDTAVGLYDKTAALLFDKDNVTLKVNAEFSLDGSWFKTVDGCWKVDGNRGWRQLHLRSPKADGTERENGYTIVTEGIDLYLMEVFTPGFYRAGLCGERNTILRSTVETKQLTGLGRALVSQADLMLGEGAVTRTEDGDIRIVLGEDAPAVVNAALNQAAMFAVKRYFQLDYDTIRAEPSYAIISNYGTVTQGILYCMRGVSVRKADITVKTGADGYPVHAEGIIGLYLETAEEGIRQLDITIRADVEDMGKTMLKKFDPKDYNVEPAPDSMDPYGYEQEQPPVNEALEDEMCLEAMDIWRYTGFNMVSTTSVSCGWNGYCYVVSLDGGDDGISKKSFFSEEGTFYHIEAEPTDWLNNMGPEDEYDFETGLDTETDEKAKAFFMEFLDNIRYEKRDQVKDLQVQWTLEKNGSLYALYEDKSDEDGAGVTFVIRITPEMRIESYSCISNG